MVLLDLIDLRLRDEPPGGSNLGGSSWADDDEDDEEDEEVWEQAAGDGGGMTKPQRLRRVTLHPCPEQPGAFWAVHDRGAWAVTLRWLPTVTKQLAAAAAAEAEGFGGLDGYGQGGEEDGEEVDSRRLPAPALRELLLSEDGITASAAVGSVLAGSSCVLLERSGQLNLARGCGAGAGAGGAAGGREGDEEAIEGLAAAGAHQREIQDAAAAAHAAVQVGGWL